MHTAWTLSVKIVSHSRYSGSLLGRKGITVLLFPLFPCLNFHNFLQDFWNEKKNENFKFSKSPFPLLDNLINSFLQILFSNWEAGTYLTQIHLFVTVKHSFAERGTLGQFFFSKLLLKYLFIQHNDFMILHQEINSYLLGPCEQCLDIGETFTFFFSLLSLTQWLNLVIPSAGNLKRPTEYFPAHPNVIY